MVVSINFNHIYISVLLLVYIIVEIGEMIYDTSNLQNIGYDL